MPGQANRRVVANSLGVVEFAASKPRPRTSGMATISLRMGDGTLHQAGVTTAVGAARSRRPLTCRRVRADQVDRGGVERVGEATQGWRPRLGAQGLQPDQGVAADAGAVGQLLLGQGSLEATAPETAEGDHGQRQWMVVGVTRVARQCTVHVIFMTTSMSHQARFHRSSDRVRGRPGDACGPFGVARRGQSSWLLGRRDAHGTPRGRQRPQTGPAMTDTEGPARGAR